MLVLSACGTPSESGLAFAGLADLLRPVRGSLAEIPERQAGALASALAIGPPVPVGRYAVCAATLSLLAAAAAQRPQLVVVDEAQSLDRSSAEALLFAARRLDADAVAQLFAVQDGQATLFDRAELPELRLAALDRESAQALLVGNDEVTIAPEVAEQLLAAAAGNPLALIELPALLSRKQLAGIEPLDEELPAAANLERAFLRQVGSLPDECRQALLVAAASDTGDLDTIVAALVALGLDPHSLEPAEKTELVSGAGGRLEFRHPLLRTAVYHAGSSAARRAAHRALADATAGDRRLDRRAWHLAAAAPAKDEATARALEEAALAARRRGGHAEAAAAFERAAALATAAPDRARRLRAGAAFGLESSTGARPERRIRAGRAALCRLPRAPRIDRVVARPLPAAAARRPVADVVRAVPPGARSAQPDDALRGSRRRRGGKTTAAPIPRRRRRSPTHGSARSWPCPARVWVCSSSGWATSRGRSTSWSHLLVAPPSTG
jgi:hypothetical protein